MPNPFLESSDTVCPRCGAEAQGGLLGHADELVEITCPDCGRFELSLVEFEQAEFDAAQAEERQE